METAVEVDTRIGTGAKFLGRRDDDFQRGVDEIVAMLLTARERARIAAQERQMATDFFAQAHAGTSLFEPIIRAPRGRVPGLKQKSTPIFCNHHAPDA